MVFPLVALILAAASLSGPGSAYGASSLGEDGSGLECDRGLEEFRRSGTIRCGHFLWDLHPEHAQAIEDPLAYFGKYERLYRFLEDLTGYSPKGPIPIRERCAPGSPGGEACPKGDLEHSYPAYRLGDELYVDAAIVGRDIVFTANHPKRPLFSSFAHEIGHIFTPFGARDTGYRWDAAMSESWADNFALLGYGMHNEQRGLGESWYWDAYCERRAGRAAPCDAFFSTVDEYASMDADAALRDYAARRRSFEDLVPAPVNDDQAHARGHILTGMLIALYREAKARGEGREFLDGFRGLVRFYHLDFPYPAAWTRTPEPLQDRRLLNRKASILVFLLSASVKRNLVRRFRDWRWPVSDATLGAVRTLELGGWREELKLKLLGLLLEDKPSKAVAARPEPVGTPARETKAGTAQRLDSAGTPAAGPDADARLAVISPVTTPQPPIDSGAVIPAPGPRPAPAAGGLFGSLAAGLGGLFDSAKKAVGSALGAVRNAVAGAVDAVKRAVGGTVETVKDALGGAAHAVWDFLKEAVSPVQRYLLPQRDPNRPDYGGLNCRFLWIWRCEPPEASYHRVQGELFVRGRDDPRDIHPSDIRQKGIGDCYIMSSLATLADQNHGLIRRNAKDNEDGTYTVTLYEKPWWVPFWMFHLEPRTFTVDNQFPLRGDDPVLAGYNDFAGQGTDTPELWVMVFEKAFARSSFNGSYNWIGNGGWPDWAMEKLTGKKSSRFKAGDVTLERLAGWRKKNHGLVVSTKSSSDDPLYADEGGTLEFSHAYWVKEADPEKGKIVLIGNPWGEWLTVTLTEAEFRRALDDVYVNPLQ